MISVLAVDRNIYKLKMPNWLKMATNDLIAQISRIKEKGIQDSMSYLFKKKQREIILKVLAEKSLTKTESEYYSRIIKKKLDAIAALSEIASLSLRKQVKREKK